MSGKCVNSSKSWAASKKRKTRDSLNLLCILVPVVLLLVVVSCQNINVDTSIVDPCTFDHETGKYSAPFTLVISNNTADEIWYTDDGVTVPMQNGPNSKKYTAPIPIDKTTIIKAKGFKENLRPSEERSATFTFVWTRGADMQVEGTTGLQGRYGFGCAAIGTKIYVIGGWQVATSPASGAVATVTVYDTVTNTWSSAPSISAPRQNVEAVTYDGKIYIIGGADASGNPVNSVEVFDPTLNDGIGKWTTGASMPTPRYLHGLATLGTNIYVFGGFNGTSQLDIIEVYNPTADSWSVSSNYTALPSPAMGFGLSTVDGKAYMSGGWTVSGATEAVYYFDPMQSAGAGSWTSLTNMNESKCYGRTIAYNGVIHDFGGEHSATTTASHYLFDPAAALGNGAWTLKTAMLVKRQYFGCVMIDGRIYIIGGAVNTGSWEPNKRVDIYEPAVD